MDLSGLHFLVCSYRRDGGDYATPKGGLRRPPSDCYECLQGGASAKMLDGEAQMPNVANAGASLISRIFLGLLVSTAILWTILGVELPANAQDSGTACALFGPSYKFNGDTVVWEMNIGSGKSCIRGVRAALAHLDDIKLTAPPRHGTVRLEGPGFVFTAEDGFKGDDSFDLSVTGSIGGVGGESVIHFLVSIR